MPAGLLGFVISLPSYFFGASSGEGFISALTLRKKFVQGMSMYNEHACYHVFCMTGNIEKQKYTNYRRLGAIMLLEVEW